MLPGLGGSAVREVGKVKKVTSHEVDVAGTLQKFQRIAASWGK